jgi:acetyl esterase/lipase
MHLLWPNGAPNAAGTGSEDCPAVTWYPVESAAPSAAMVVCPGGGYARRAAHEAEPVAQWLNGIGIAAAVLRYRVAPYMHPNPLLDAQRAIRFVRHHAKQWNVDPTRVGILGFSAGGHLACTAGTHFDAGHAEAEDPIDRQSCRPDVMVLCYPVVTFGQFAHEGSKLNLLGANPPSDLVEALSGEKQVTPLTPPAFIWHTADDKTVPVENSLQLAAAMSRQRVPFELHVFESGNHGLGLAGDHQEAKAWPDLCAAWLRKQGF